MCKAINQLPVGSLFEYRKVRLQVVERFSCSLCFFFSHKAVHCFGETLADVPPCSGMARSDGKNVFLKKVADIDD